MQQIAGALMAARAAVTALVAGIALHGAPAAGVLVVVVEERPDRAVLVVAAPRVAPAVALLARSVSEGQNGVVIV